MPTAPKDINSPRILADAASLSTQIRENPRQNVRHDRRSHLIAKDVPEKNTPKSPIRGARLPVLGSCLTGSSGAGAGAGPVTRLALVTTVLGSRAMRVAAIFMPLLSSKADYFSVNHEYLILWDLE